MSTLPPAGIQAHRSAKLVIDKNLNKLPRRKTDGAVILRCRDSSTVKAAVFKLNASSADPMLVKRYEKSRSSANLS